MEITDAYSFFSNLTFYHDDYLAVHYNKYFAGCLLFSSLEYLNENALKKKEKVPGLDRHLGRRLMGNQSFCPENHFQYHSDRYFIHTESMLLKNGKFHGYGMLW